MPDNKDANTPSGLTDVAITITLDPKQINYRSHPNDQLDKTLMQIKQFLDDISTSYNCVAELTQSQVIHYHAYIKQIKHQIYGKSKLLDSMFNKIKIHAKQYKYIGHIHLKLCSHYKQNIDGWINYIYKNINITSDTLDRPKNEIEFTKDEFNGHKIQTIKDYLIQNSKK